MKFYEFNGEFEYYALIAADELVSLPRELAINKYKEVIEIEDDEWLEFYGGCKPTEVSKEYALNKYISSEIEGCKTKKEKEKDFYKTINSDSLYCILLVDKQLL